MEDTTWHDTIGRLLTALNATSEAALGAKLGISSQAIYNAKKKKQVPPAWVFQAAKTYGVSADWIFFGRGPMRPGNAAQEPLEKTGHAEIQQQTVTPCPRCARLEARLDALEEERRELSVENRKLWKENGELREKCARLEHLDEPIMGRAKSA